MVGTVDRLTPCLDVPAITATAGLLSNEETDVVICVVGSFKAARAEDAAIVECAIPRQLFLARYDNGVNAYTHLQRKQLSPFLNM